MSKLLIADDNPAILDSLTIMLEDAGYEVETTEDGLIAQNMQPPYPDLLLLDVSMSGIDGRDVCKLLKGHAETQHVPIVMMSATKDIERIARNAGADDYISKPFQMDHMLEIVASRLNNDYEISRPITKQADVPNNPKATVLIVDDESVIRHSVRLALEEQDFMDIKIIESSSVASGIRQVEKVQPDLVILDLHMPNKNGFDFIDIMKRNKLIAKTKIIMLTVDDTFKNIFIAESKGVDALYFLAKPFNVSDLQAMVFKTCLSPTI
ncbi:response regulator [Polaromonas sp.]|nr:response regulator [Candidatus Saccharibacteria bacterium]